MNAASQKSNRPTLLDSRSATSLQVSEDGRTHCVSQAGPTIDLSGQDHARASHSRWPESALVKKTIATSGQSLDVSSRSRYLQSCLESRLRRNLDVDGSPEYELTWKQLDMPLGPPICALLASGRRTSGKGFTGWPTCAARDWRDGRSNQHGKNARPLNEVAQLSGWATPCVADSRNTRNETAKRGVGRKFNPGQTLVDQASGQTIPPSNAGTERPAGFRLNPRFSLWLMGYNPDALAYCGERAMQSFRKSRRNSSTRLGRS